MNYWKVILATVVIFGTGVLTGGLLVNYVNHPPAKNPRHSSAGADARLPENHEHVQPRPAEIPMPRLARELGKQFVQQLNETLKLTPEQHEKIEKIIADGQERNHEIWTNTVPKMRVVMQEVDQQIRAELTPEQLKPFEDLLKHPARRPPAGNLAPPVPTNAPGI